MRSKRISLLLIMLTLILSFQFPKEIFAFNYTTKTGYDITGSFDPSYYSTVRTSNGNTVFLTFPSNSTAHYNYTPTRAVAFDSNGNKVYDLSFGTTYKFGFQYYDYSNFPDSIYVGNGNTLSKIDLNTGTSTNYTVPDLPSKYYVWNQSVYSYVLSGRISISPNGTIYAVVNGPEDSNNKSSMDIYTLINGTWTLQQSMIPPTMSPSTYYNSASAGYNVYWIYASSDTLYIHYWWYQIDVYGNYVVNETHIDTLPLSNLTGSMTTIQKQSGSYSYTFYPSIKSGDFIVEIPQNSNSNYPINYFTASAKAFTTVGYDYTGGSGSPHTNYYVPYLSVSKDLTNPNVVYFQASYSPGGTRYIYLRSLDISTLQYKTIISESNLSGSSSSTSTSYSFLSLMGTSLLDSSVVMSMANGSTFYYLVPYTQDNVSDLYVTTEVGQAANAAQSAQTAAQNAQTAAQAAQNGTNTIINNYLSTSAGVIQDSSGNTVLSIAKQASQNALNANTNASTSAANAQNAYNQAVTATNSANTAASNAANANTTLGASAGVVQDSSGTVLQSARQAVTDINNTQTSLSNQMNGLQTSITNIQNYIAPTLNKVSGYNAATATSGSTFNVSLDYSVANEYQVKVDNGSWSGWTSLASHDTNGYFTVSGISAIGLHTIYVQIRYNGGASVSPVAKGKMTIFRV